nr:ecdysone-induced protein 74EF-like [Biomphalaria glabrata]
MDRGTTAGTPGYHSGERQASVSTYITSLVLLVGVFGGLVIVVTVILVCTYCQGKRKPDRSTSSRENVSDNTLRALQRYETINSDIFSDPSSYSFDIPQTPRKTVDFRLPDRVSEQEGATETTNFRSDFPKDEFGDQHSTFYTQVDETETTSAQGTAATSSKTSQNGGNAGSGSRYIEGDFHHLKHSKIGKNLPRQFSMGGAVPGRSLLEDPQFKFNSLDERKTFFLPPIVAQEAQRAHSSLLQPTEPLPPQLQQQQQPKQLQQQTSRESRRTSIERETSPKHLRDNRLSLERETSPKHLRDNRLSLERETSPKHSRDNRLSLDQLKPNKRDSPSPTYRTPKGLKNSPSPTFNFIKDVVGKNSPSPPLRPIPDSPSNFSPLATRDTGVKGSPPSPFRPINEMVSLGSSPSPTYKSAKTQISVEVHNPQQIHSFTQHSISGSHHVPSTSQHSSIGSQHTGAPHSHSGEAVADEQHKLLLARLERTRSYTDSCNPPKKTLLLRSKAQHKTMYSHSLESANPSRQKCYRNSRKVKSYGDDHEDHDVLKITEFSRGPFYNADYDIILELGSPTVSKVRYNDTGSLEQLNDAEFSAELEVEEATVVEDKKEQERPDDNEDSAETLNGTRKYRALWRLRATLEEDEECSDNIRMEDITSPDDSPDREHVTPATTSFESNAQSDPCPSDHRDSGIQFESTTSSRPGHQANFLHPNYENRRQNYRNVINNRFQRNNQSTSVENSFDSVETDGDVSDTSRYEVTTTSFESSTTTTTENTDSTTESQASKLRQMKADSGYKSLETQQQSSKECGEHETMKWDIRMSVDCCEGISARRDSKPIVDGVVGFAIRRSSKAEIERLEGLHHERPIAGAVASGIEPSPLYRDSRHISSNVINAKAEGPHKSPPSSTTHFDRRNGKTASKKRREYSREKQTVQVYESINEPPTCSKPELHSGDSFEDSSIPNKISVFARFFKSHSRGHRSRYLVRDYSIDEKTNSIFNEFVRQEIPTTPHEPAGASREATTTGRLGIRRSPRLHRHRLQRKHTEPALLCEDRASRRDRLAPSVRSSSLGSDSSASSARRISPQDSIEEEEDEIDEEVLHIRRIAAWSNCHTRSPVTFVQRQLQSVTLQDRSIPIIKLPEEDLHETSVH